MWSFAAIMEDMTQPNPAQEFESPPLVTGVAGAGTARQRARAQTERELLQIARRHLGEVGAAALSLRAIAREKGMVSSAIYRYFSSRDALLTKLIIEAYDELGEYVEAEENRVPRNEYRNRFARAARAIREWAIAHPHQYALIYGSPVPGYAAPQDTVGSAARVGLVLFKLLRDVFADRPAPRGSSALDRATPGIAQLAADYCPGVPAEVVLMGVESWSRLHGAVSFEVFGQFNRMVEDPGSLYEFIIDEELARLELER